MLPMYLYLNEMRMLTDNARYHGTRWYADPQSEVLEGVYVFCVHNVWSIVLIVKTCYY